MSITAAEARAIALTSPPDDLAGLASRLAGRLVRPEEMSDTLSISEAAELIGASAHTLRWYERIGLVTVSRTAGGQRSYDAAAIGRLLFITRLRLTDMPIAEIQRYFTLVAAGPATIDERLALLSEHRANLQRRLDEMGFAMAVLDYKIAGYRKNTEGPNGKDPE